MRLSDIEQVASRALNSGPCKEAISDLQRFADAHPITVTLLIKAVFPRAAKLRAIEDVMTKYRSHLSVEDFTELERAGKRLSEELTEIFSYVLPTPKGPRRKPTNKDDFNYLVGRAIRDAGMEPLAAIRAVQEELSSPLPAGRPPTARRSAVLALELKHGDRGLTMRQIADKVCSCGNKQHKPRCECLTTLRREIRELKKAVEKYGL